MSADAASPPLLVVQHLSVSLQKAPVLVDLSFTCLPQQIVAIVGIEGAGKTTLLKSLGGLQRPLAGHIFFAGEPVEALPSWEMVRRGVIYVPEGMRVFPGMTVLENLEVGAYLVRRQLKARLDQACQIFPELKDRLRAAGEPIPFSDLRGEDRALDRFIEAVDSAGRNPAARLACRSSRWAMCGCAERSCSRTGL